MTGKFTLKAGPTIHVSLKASPAMPDTSDVFLDAGSPMPDGTVFVGISPTNSRPLYTMPNNLAGLYSVRDGLRATARERFGSHADWRLPTRSELRLLSEKHAEIGGFDEGWYWSFGTTAIRHLFWARHFATGLERMTDKYLPGRVRLVRG